MKTRAIDTLQFGHEEIDLSAVEQIFDTSQTRAIGGTVEVLADWIRKPQMRGKTLAATLDALDKEINARVECPLAAYLCRIHHS